MPPPEFLPTEHFLQVAEVNPSLLVKLRMLGILDERVLDHDQRERMRDIHEEVVTRLSTRLQDQF